MNKLSCIIPAYNEGSRIKNVLDVVVGHPLINEIVVVDDASTDDTGEVVRLYEGVQLLVHKVNQGKSKSVYDGIKFSTGDTVMLLDADLVGITKENLTDLIEPVMKSESGVSISLRINAPKLWRVVGIDYISGERVMPRQLIFQNIEEILTLPGFGLEVFLNKLIIKKHLKICVVPWNNVISPYKYKKYGYCKGIKYDIKMMFEIFKTVGVFGAARQIISMIELKK